MPLTRYLELQSCYKFAPILSIKVELSYSTVLSSGVPLAVGRAACPLFERVLPLVPLRMHSSSICCWGIRLGQEY